MHFIYQALSVLAASLLVSSATAQCKVGQAWPDSTNCHNFYECASGGTPVLKTCGPGTAYCPMTGVCVHEQKVPSCFHNGHPSGGHHSEGHHFGGHHSEGQHSEGHHSEGQQSQGQHSEGQHSEGQHSEGHRPEQP
ncbi:hypothetical protein CNMCM6106_005393 [Aspergillus hiratsukae]|uniref:Chitin-binding type-2 domain-containing protein n=1 Tax=Aspergillus hiratsukae TaxID=1194566 RepID=A0A8H6UXX6_9EURO|nr:hypothetical protein CNMCM6106_005393 [Aspergillus hiratsukae]